jgi:hypothetical protein
MLGADRFNKRDTMNPNGSKLFRRLATVLCALPLLACSKGTLPVADGMETAQITAYNHTEDYRLC